jgi:hypothetical protein
MLPNWYSNVGTEAGAFMTGVSALFDNPAAKHSKRQYRMHRDAINLARQSHAQSVQLFTTKRQKGQAVSVAGTMQMSAGKLALRFLQASFSQLECELVA